MGAPYALDACAFISKERHLAAGDGGGGILEAQRAQQRRVMLAGLAHLQEQVLRGAPTSLLALAKDLRWQAALPHERLGLDTV